MTTKELIQWVLDAEDYHEKNWTKDKLGRKHPLIFQEECLKATKPKNPTHGEFQIAQILFRDYWNDCQDWIKDL